MSDISDTTADTTRASTPSGRRPWKWLLSGLLLGILLVFGIRFATYDETGHETHYHANFALYVNGTQEQFKDPRYYEEVQICDLHGSSPKARTHMHSEEAGVVHVHDSAVTWGDFFANLGWTVGPNFIADGDKLYTASDETKLNIILNGEDMTDLTDIASEVIGDKDRLLLSYGPADDATLQQQFRTVRSDAARYNATQDPAACGGSEKPTVRDRFMHLL